MKKILWAFSVLTFFLHTELKTTEDDGIGDYHRQLADTRDQIVQDIDKLTILLQQEPYKTTADQKGWLNPELRLSLPHLRETLDPLRGKVLRDIGDHYRRNKNYDLMNMAMNPLDKLSKIPELMMRGLIDQHFSRLGLLPIRNIRENSGGIQFKRMVDVGEPPVTYYVKTHSGGLLQQTAHSTRKPLEILEPLTYKILQHAGYGPECHFFFHDLQNFYIATRDAGSYAAPRQALPIQSFTQFLKEDQKSFREDVTPERNPIIRGLMVADILSRLLGLTDIITQDGNMLFIAQGDTWKILLIDFRLVEGGRWRLMAAGPQLTSGQILFQGLLNGNRECNYLGMNSIIAHYLGAKDLPLRLDHAKTFNYDALSAAVTKSKDDLVRFITQTENIEVLRGELDKVTSHVDRVLEDITEFKKAVQTYSP